MIRNILSREDLPFFCTGCGDCCKGGGNVYFSEEELLKIKEFLKLDENRWNVLTGHLIQFKKNNLSIHRSNKACIFLDKENKCRIYSVRPLQCRSYPFWPSVFSSPQEFKAHVRHCEGFRRTEESFSLLKTVRRVNATVRIFNAQQKNPIDPIEL